jgi:hypothetical protein
MTQKLELGKNISFEQLKQMIATADLNMKVKAAYVVQGNYGTLIALRSLLEEHMISSGGELVYGTVTADPIYVVKWNDLSPEKQKSIERKQKKYEGEFGWYWQYVCDSKDHPYGINIHTHGLSKYGGHPDIQLCLLIPSNKAQDLLHSLVDNIKDGARYEVGVRYSDILVYGYEVCFIKVGEDLIRIILPDSSNNLEADTMGASFREQYKVDFGSRAGDE